jgi:hypothetical protein
LRRAANIKAIVNSATPRALAPSALSIRMPSSCATPSGILSVPVPFRLITRSFFAARNTRSEIGSTPAIHPTHSGKSSRSCSSVGIRPGFVKINSNPAASNSLKTGSLFSVRDRGEIKMRRLISLTAGEYFSNGPQLSSPFSGRWPRSEKVRRNHARETESLPGRHLRWLASSHVQNRSSHPQRSGFFRPAALLPGGGTSGHRDS